LWIRRCESLNFRNLSDGPIAFHNGINWFCGDNGQGKTNLLELVYYGLTSKSFRANRGTELVRDTKAPMSVRAEIVKDERVTRFGVTLEKGTTTRYLSGKVCKSMAFFEAAAAIAFTARSKLLIEGSPEDRRRALDRMIAYLEPEHVVTMARYRRSLGQLRKALQARDLTMYRGFKSVLVPVALKIVERRRHFLEHVRERASTLFRDLFSGDGALCLDYLQRGRREGAELDKRMMDVCAQEILQGRMLIGPHLDDLEITLASERAKRRASSGQIRAIVLSLEIAVRESYKNRRGHRPILLLDDIDAELDPRRLDNLITYLSGRGQTLISTSKYATMKPERGSRIFEVNAGRISPLRIEDDNR